jgi:hypothetical protein
MHTRLGIAIAGMLFIAASGCAPMNHDSLLQQVQLITDQNDIIAAANRLFICTDTSSAMVSRCITCPTRRTRTRGPLSVATIFIS